MAFDTRISSAYKDQFRDEMGIATQQRGSILRQHVSEQNIDGEGAVAADLVQKGEYTEDVGRRRSNIDDPSEVVRRWLVYRDPIATGQYIDNADLFRQMGDHTSKLMTEHSSRIRRGIDDRILGVKRKSNGTFGIAQGGILGPATEGKRPGATVDLPAAQKIAADGDGLTLDKLVEAYEKFGLDDFDLDMEDPVMAISPKQNTDLIAIIQAAGSNLNLAKESQVIEGKVRRLMNINFVITNRLPVNNAGNRICPVWMKEMVVAGFHQDIKPDAWNDTSARNTPYMHVDAYLDCVRTEDIGVQQIDCVES